jgi:hypothetical protein
MTRFTEHELAFLHSGPGLGRIATVDADGDPHVVPTGWSYNSEGLDSTGFGERFSRSVAADGDEAR